ncbi:LmbU family transcriptional regulator [Nocardiopsis xinjiangensis]|uniref:LmbU family transcriptional regulator n=1 Tax=Nocardiopsis xinjiangensis TaxID=124285 RepID=UPI000477469A|nr:LmbU family transcriptional regulator [Nocardiopsis xinjiangensis]
MIIPRGVEIEEWRRLGRQINVISDSSSWWLGDWLLYGQNEYPNRYKKAIEETSLDYQTLRNYSWVARRFPPEYRRSTLSFQHHAEVASRPQEEQEKWLDKAEQYGWSRNKLRRMIRESRTSEASDISTINIKMNLDLKQKKRWEEAAERQDKDLVSWIISVLEEAVEPISMSEHLESASATAGPPSITSA